MDVTYYYQIIKIQINDLPAESRGQSVDNGTKSLKQ